MRKRTLTVSYLADGRTTFPFIRFRGLWLAEAGFHPGDTIEVQVEHGRLIVTKVNPDGSEVEAPRDPSLFEFMHGLPKREPKDGDGEE